MVSSARKKALRRAAVSDPGLCDDDASSVATSTLTMSEWGADGGSDVDMSPLESAIELLYEKRGATRERGLEALTAILACTFDFDEVFSKRETLESVLLNSLRKGGAMEAALAARAVGLLAVSLGAGDETDSLLEAARPTLVKAAKAGKATSVRVAATEALAMIAFIGGDDYTAAKLMQMLEGLRTAAPPVAAAALRGWSLLLTTQPSQRLDIGGDEATSVEGRLAGLGKALDAEDVAVRQAAGEGAALLYSQSGLAADRDSNDGSGPATPDDLPAVTGAPLSTGAAQMDDVMSRMRELATHRGDATRRSKRDRSALKTTFRDLVSSVEDGSVATAKVRLQQGDTLTVDSLAGIVQLNAFRRFLAEGFQHHLQANPLLHEVFGFTPTAAPADSFDSRYARGLEKRLVHHPKSPAAKAATRQRASAREASALRKGASYSNLALGNDGSEW